MVWKDIATRLVVVARWRERRAAYIRISEHFSESCACGCLCMCVCVRVGGHVWTGVCVWVGGGRGESGVNNVCVCGGVCAWSAWGAGGGGWGGEGRGDVGICRAGAHALVVCV